MNFRSFLQKNPFTSGFAISTLFLTALGLIASRTGKAFQLPEELLLVAPPLLLLRMLEVPLLRRMGVSDDQINIGFKLGAGVATGAFLVALVGLVSQSDWAKSRVPRLLKFGEAGSQLVKRADNPEVPLALTHGGHTIVLKV